MDDEVKKPGKASSPKRPEPGTERLFFDDSYALEFTAAVKARTEKDGRPVVILDRTCFYPESGGQPADRGTLNGVPVVDVQEEGGEVLHVLEREMAGDKVKGKVDWPRRFDHMQQHTGQHILSQAFILELEGETRGFHLGEEVSTLEIGLRDAKDDELERVERRANDAVFSDLEVKTYFVPEEKIGDVPLRRPPKVEGTIRVVEVDGFDHSACGGTHCRRTGEVGLIKIIGTEKIRNNVRFTFVCGARALTDYGRKDDLLRRTAGLLSVHENDVPEAVEKSQAEAKAQRKDMRSLQERLARFEAAEMVREAGGKILSKYFDDRTPDEARMLALAVIRQAPLVVVFVARSGGRTHFIFARHETLTADMKKISAEVSSWVNGRGGGSPSLAEIVTEESIQPEEILKRLGSSLHL